MATNVSVRSPLAIGPCTYSIHYSDEFASTGMKMYIFGENHVKNYPDDFIDKLDKNLPLEMFSDFLISEISTNLPRKTIDLYLELEHDTAEETIGEKRLISRTKGNS